MIIAHVLSSFGMGGQERVALDLARGQLAAGHRVLAISLAAPPEGPHADNFRRASVSVYTVPKGPGLDLNLARRLRRLFAQERVELVHTHNPHAMIYGAPAGRLAGGAVVHSKHGANPDTRKRRWLRRIASQFVDAYVAVSPTTAEIARRDHDCAPRKLHMIPNGIDLASFAADPGARRAVRQEFGINENARVVGTVGRLAPEKNQKLLIEALSPVLSESVVLMIVGSGPESERLQNLSAGLPNGKHVIFTGARPDAARLLNAFDIFALSSLTEGLPLVIPEAMATGLPVVSTAVGGIPDVIEDDQTGFLVPSADATRLRDKLVVLIQDGERCRRLGTRAREVAHGRYGAERMLHDYMQLYVEVLSSEHGHSSTKPASGDLEAYS
jgi:glycosyltransferase involved in cell wall biosynthesis